MKLTSIGGSNNDGLFRAENGTIYFRKYREGKGEICRSTKTTSLERARKRREELMEELWGDAPLKAKRQIVGELWAVWYEGMEITKSKGTAVSIASSWKHLEAHAGGRFLDEITAEWWTNSYIPRKREESGASRKFFNERKWLGMFLKWCDETGKGDRGWKRPKLTNPDPKRESGRAYSDDEIRRLLEQADWKLKAKIIMGCHHFMRRNEVATLAKDRVDRVNRTIHLRALDTKIRKPRTFPYSEQLEQIFVILDAENEKAGINSPFVFPSPVNPDQPIGPDGFKRAWGTAKRNAGNIKGRFHDLRHTGLTKAFKAKGSNAALICHFAGLSLEEAERTYLHFTTDDLRGVENLVE